MTKTSIVVAVSLGWLATLGTPATADADRRFHGRGGSEHFSHGHSLGKNRHGGHSFHGRGHSFHGRGHSFHGRGHFFDGHGRSLHRHGRSFHGHSLHAHGFGHHRSFPRHFLTFGLVAPPAVVFSPPVLQAPPSVFIDAPPHSGPVHGQSAPAPPAPRVVEYPTGRYELRGDGISTPYTWVWIPNPPPAPPPPPPP
jgi:hypothetical protein